MYKTKNLLKMKEIYYLKGDATSPIGPGNKVIPHICNDIGAWGAGFVLAISARWKAPERMYRSLTNRVLGTVLFVPVEEDITVANMIAQHNTRPDNEGNYPIRYYAVRECLKEVNRYAVAAGATLHMPRIGCGLAGGTWIEIEKIIEDVVTVDVYVYDLK
jgi:O-acetyl-ADP-ribose deacetylase (regulator of RNase III)